MVREPPIPVAVFDAQNYDEEFLAPAFRAVGLEPHFHSARLSPATVKLADGARAVCVFVNDDLGRAVIDALVGMNVGLIALRCAGFNNVDFEACHGRIRVVRVPAYSPHAVAEHAVALLLALNRKIHRAWLRTRDNNFSIHGLLGFDLFGKTAGIVGTGKIGRVVAEIFQGFGLRRLAYDPFPDTAWAARTGVEYVPLEKLWAESDIITLHCPLTPETVGIINAKTIAQMKRGVVVINTGRGRLIDTRALLHGLKSGRIGAAGLDVYEEEERYFFRDLSLTGIDDDVLARLTTFPNVIITAHQAFFTQEAMTAIARTTAKNIRAWSHGEPLVHEVCLHCARTGQPHEAHAVSGAS